MTSPANRNFLKINGQHPWRTVSPHGFVDYPVRYRRNGRILFFNFPLARELGLISQRHPPKMNSKLENAILYTFSLQIINEYDREHKAQFSKSILRPRPYMATRYLQLQHKNRQGKTSGDGRSIWNGVVKTPRKIFDVSSCGTGATCLSPGFNEAGRPLKTGDGRFGYASGLAEASEMLSNALMSEIFYREGIPTERCLAVIDFKDKTAIGVRTAPNLIRPAHVFRYLKLGWWKELKASFDYFLKRQEQNKVLSLPARGKKRYDKSLQYLARTYAKLAAVLEEEYIFNWLAWDGDNMLASGALLDYGSIRQFVAKHSKYRYDDAQRFSTCLSEQRREARNLVRVFAQSADFILTQSKKPLSYFGQNKYLRIFDRYWERERQRRMLWRVGFAVKQIEHLIRHAQGQVKAFAHILDYFEEVKTVKGEQTVPDGIDHPPVFLVRDILRELPIYFYRNHNKDCSWPFMPPKDFFKIMAAYYVNREDLALTENRRRKAYWFQKLYRGLINASGKNQIKTLKQIVSRSAVINYDHRMTGNGLLWVVDEALKARNRLDRREFQHVIDRFIDSQVLIPGTWKPLQPQEMKGSLLRVKQLRRLQRILEEYNERIK